jgi:hypothetical protein
MLRNYDKHNLGNISFSTSQKAANAIVGFLNSHLPSFPAFLKEQKLESYNEDKVSSMLEIFLQRMAKHHNEVFMFQFQSPQANSKRTVDISVIYASPFSSTESIFAIEAKRLPTPGSGREREYVVGNLGAIERFKRCHHGKHLRYSAIFGYIEDKNFDHWHSQICSWINDLIKTNTDSIINWNKNDLLSFLKAVKGVNLYNSLNARVDKTEISLTHYWININ